MHRHFFGIVPAMATPFDERFEIDEGALKVLIDWYIDAGVHGLSVAGSQGEFFFMEADERIRLIAAAARHIGGRVPLYAGTGAVSTRESIKLTQAAEADGADLALAITPFFVSPAPDELYHHYRAIAEATKLPVMLYNNPPRTGVNVTVDTFCRCFEIDNVTGMKDSSGDLTQMVEYGLRTDGKALVFAGRDTLILSHLTHGGSGAISPAANVFPRLLVRLYDLVRDGEIEQARRISNILAPLRAAWAWASFPVVIKEAMALAGHSAGPTRPPVRGIARDKKEQLHQLVSQIQQAERDELAVVSQT
jgi:4-hydroxy-tetrahydrodipicolinate synthase